MTGAGCFSLPALRARTGTRIQCAAAMIFWLVERIGPDRILPTDLMKFSKILPNFVQTYKELSCCLKWQMGGVLFSNSLDGELRRRINVQGPFIPEAPANAREFSASLPRPACGRPGSSSTGHQPVGTSATIATLVDSGRDCALFSNRLIRLRKFRSCPASFRKRAMRAMIGRWLRRPIGRSGGTMAQPRAISTRIRARNTEELAHGEVSLLMGRTTSTSTSCRYDVVRSFGRRPMITTGSGDRARPRLGHQQAASTASS